MRGENSGSGKVHRFGSRCPRIIAAGICRRSKLMAAVAAMAALVFLAPARAATPDPGFEAS